MNTVSQERTARKRALTAEECSLFLGQAAMVLRSGVPLADGMEALCQDFAQMRAGEELKKLGEAVAREGSLYAALQNVPVLPAYAIHMIHVGEEAGKLDDVLEGLSDTYAREGIVRKNMKQAVLYPALLTLLMGAVIAVLVFRVMPVFLQVLRGLGSGLSGSADRFMSAGVAIGWGVLALTGGLILAALAVFLLLKTKRRESVLESMRRRVPVFKRLSSALEAERFAQAMGMLLKSGYPLEDALQLVKELSGNPRAAEKIERIRTDVLEGAGFSEAVEKAGIFEALHARMLRAGAAAGQLDQVMDKLKEIYRERMDRSLSALEALIEPVLVTLLAVIAGAILLSVMLPLAGLLSSML